MSTTRLALLVAALLAPGAALAWKPTTHVYLAEIAADDALDDGRVSFRRLDDGRTLTYAVDPQTLAALRNARPQYRAGVLGPDAYPDIATGQQIIHPDGEETGVPHGSDAWLRHVWRQFDGSDRERAFRLGFLTHAAGDMYGHSFINLFTGAPFTLNPPENAIKHVVLEGYIDKRLPAAALRGSFFDASIAGLEGRIHSAMIDAQPGGTLDTTLMPRNSPGGKFSVPRIFSTLRADLQRDITLYYARKQILEQRISACKAFDFTCSAVALSVELAAHVTANALPTTYKERWRDDIDRGLRAWPATSHEVAKALFFNPQRRADIDRADAVLSDYAQRHLLSMAGAPDFVGLTTLAIGKIIDAITPDWLLQPIRALKEDILNAMLKSTLGMTKAELRGYLTQPDRYFDQVMTRGAGTRVSLRDFNRDYLFLRDVGYRDPAEAFDWTRVPATWNTVVLSKLILMSPNEVNRMMADLGAGARLNDANEMLGFIRTLDGSMQWRSGMTLAQDCAAYAKLLMPLPGGGGCAPS